MFEKCISDYCETEGVLENITDCIFLRKKEILLMISCCAQKRST